MIVELFGLPGSGKTTLARGWTFEGAHVIAPPGKKDLILLNLLFFVLHPIRFTGLLFALFRHAPPRARRLLFMNSFLIHNAKYLIAQRVSARGGIALIDQGHFQNPLSIFDTPPPEHVLKGYLALLPKPDLLVVLDVPKAVREERLEKRGNIPRIELGPEAAAEAAATAESNLPRILSLLSLARVHYRMISGADVPSLKSICTENLTYATAARVPTEKAHGVSITAMASAFAGLGKRTLLLVPTRKNQIEESIFSYYGTADDFQIERLHVPDFVGSGFTSSPFFFLQRLLFMFKLLSLPPPPGIIYTREPEIAWVFSKRFPTLYEAHRMPRGFAGWLTASLTKDVTLVVCNSRGTEAAFRARGIAQTVVAPNGFHPDRFQGPFRSRDELGLPKGFLAMYAGSEERWKGASVFRAASRHAPEVVFAALGGNLRGERHGVHEFGRVRREDIGEYLRNADVLVLPNTRDSEESERYTSPIKLFEYLAAGKPIVASDLSSIREIVGEDDVVFVPPGDPVALGGALERLRTDASRAARLAARSQALAPGYTWRARAERILKALP